MARAESAIGRGHGSSLVTHRDRRQRRTCSPTTLYGATSFVLPGWAFGYRSDNLRSGVPAHPLGDQRSDLQGPPLKPASAPAGSDSSAPSAAGPQIGRFFPDHLDRILAAVIAGIAGKRHLSLVRRHRSYPHGWSRGPGTASAASSAPATTASAAAALARSARPATASSHFRSMIIRWHGTGHAGRRYEPRWRCDLSWYGPGSVMSPLPCGTLRGSRIRLWA